MPQVPAAITKEIAGLRKAVRAGVPARTASNLLIGSWNLRAFGGLTGKWNSGPADSPKRDWRSVALIAELISHFDVFAVQEVRRSTTALRFLMERLGPSWRFITSDVTEGDAGNGERSVPARKHRTRQHRRVGDLCDAQAIPVSARPFAPASRVRRYRSRSGSRIRQLPAPHRR